MNLKKITTGTLMLTAATVASCGASGINSTHKSPSSNSESNKSNRPNIVVIIADDLLSSELSCYGGQNLDTKNIDQLAKEGVRFTQNYASMSMSVPIRASMYTGLYPAKNGSYRNHKNTFEGTKTVVEYMNEEGYRVGRTGKNHPNTPSVYKFEEIPGFTVNCLASKANTFSVDGIKEFISRNDDPFLLYVCSIHPHVPWDSGDPSEFNADDVILPEFCVKSPQMRNRYRSYLAEIRQLDNEVGAVVQTLKEQDKYDNTIVIFLGEQGPQLPGGKWTCWYPGVNSALIARYPDKIESGSVCNAIVQYEDLLPTFIDIAEGEQRTELDGVSFKQALFGETQVARKYAYIMHNNIPEGDPYPIRSIRDGRYALLWNLSPQTEYYCKHMQNPNNTSGTWALWKRTQDDDPYGEFWIDRFLERPEFEFYDLLEDPHEKNNLAGQVVYKDKIEEMKQELTKWMTEQGDKGAEMEFK